jgi:hypothetical protein
VLKASGAAKNEQREAFAVQQPRASCTVGGSWCFSAEFGF